MTFDYLVRSLIKPHLPEDGIENRHITVTQPSSPQPALDKLPNELLNIFAKFVRHSDLLALRKTCRVLCKNANDAFGEAFFSERKHILSDHSLDALLEISTHTRFSRHVHTIKLGSALIKDFVPTFKQNKPVLLPYFTKVYQEQRICLWEGKRAFAILQDVFRNLRQHNRTVSIGVYDDLVENQILGIGHGSQRFYGPLDGAFSAELIPTMMLQLLIEAAMAADCNIRGIEIATDQCDNGLAASTAWGSGIYRGMLRDLRELKIESKLPRRSPLFLTAPTDISSTDNLLFTVKGLTNAASNLDSFGFHGGDHGMFGGPELSTLCFNQTILTTNLKELSLTNTSVQDTELISLLSKHKTTLRHLSILNCRVESDIKLVFECMTDNLALESLSFGIVPEQSLTSLLTQGFCRASGIAFGFSSHAISYFPSDLISRNPTRDLSKSCPIPLSLRGDWGTVIQPRLYDAQEWMEDMSKAIKIQAETELVDAKRKLEDLLKTLKSQAE